jgi:outer membrane protease
MKNLCVKILLFFFCHIPACALLSASLEGTGGVFSYTNQEHILENDGSLLDWRPDSVIPAFSLRGNLEFLGVFFLGGGILSAIPVQNGVMGNYEFHTPGTYSVSRYSRHDAYLDRQFDLAAELGCHIYKSPYGWSLSLAGGILYRNRKWSAADGYTQSPEEGPPWTGDEERLPVSGAALSYQQALWFPYIVLEAKTPAFDNDRLEFSAKYVVYPYIQAETALTLSSRGLEFDETPHGGIGLRVEGALRFYLDAAKKTALAVSGSYEWIKFGGLTDEARSNGGGYEAGMESGAWHVSLGFSVSFRDIL